VYGTNKGKIHGWDLRMKKEAWILDNPPNLGLLGTFVVEPFKNWILTGTSSGYYTCWDIRFHIPVKSWRHPSKARIHSLVHYNSAKFGSWVFSTSGNSNEVAVWDVESASCRQIFRVLTTEETPSIPSMKALDAPNALDYGVEDLQMPSIINNNPNAVVGIKCMLIPQEAPYVITGGDDKRIRYWDLSNAINSYTICGLENDQAKPRYSSHLFDSINVYQEHPNFASNSSESQTSTINKHRAASPTVNHHESILDVQYMELPHRMLISGSRDGVIKVWK